MIVQEKSLIQLATIKLDENSRYAI